MAGGCGDPRGIQLEHGPPAGAWPWAVGSFGRRFVYLIRDFHTKSTKRRLKLSMTPPPMTTRARGRAGGAVVGVVATDDDATRRHHQPRVLKDLAGTRKVLD